MTERDRQGVDIDRETDRGQTLTERGDRQGADIDREETDRRQTLIERQTGSRH